MDLSGETRLPNDPGPSHDGLSSGAPWMPHLILIPLSAGILSFLFGERFRRILIAAAIGGTWFSLIRLALDLDHVGPRRCFQSAAG